MSTVLAGLARIESCQGVSFVRVSPSAELGPAVRRELLSWLERYRQLALGDSSWAYPGFADLVAEHGVFYSPAPWTGEVRQEPGRCFKAASAHAERSALVYAEGYALARSAVPFVVFEHAWCVGGDGRAVDPALPDGMVQGYLGVPLNGAFRREQQRLRGTDAVFVSDPRNLFGGVNEVVLRAGLPEGAVASPR
ncbi:hypothetical protein ABTY61_22715 [Kitasatospora sp. NPDC096128]|uniref:hypothetical protein n=1 Tax=Kitasatospora sp. NPDC096128 TaxID=3155547 RepID=UPI0033276686